MMKNLLVATAFVLAGTAAQAADIAAGKALAEAQCAACHAAGGDWNKPIDPSYPKLAGQHKDYLVSALKHYQNGGRNNAIMAGMAAGLSADDISNVSAFLAGLESDLYLKK